MPLARLSRAAPLMTSLVLAGCGSAGGAANTSPTASGAPAAAVHDGDWRTFDYNAQRTGVGPSRTGITTANIKKLRLRTVRLPGVADSTAIQLHAIDVAGKRRDVDVVTTTYGRTIAFDPATGAHLWSYAPKDIGNYQGSPQITTASPVADPTRHYVYAASPNGFIHKLNVSSGRQVWAARVTWDPRREKIGGALNLSGRYVVVVTGGYYGDAPTYQGHVALIDRATGAVKHVWNSLCSNRHHLLHPPRSCPASDSAIWARAGAVVEPGTHRLLVATGNGPFNGHTDWGDSVLELSANARRLMHNWTPKDQATLKTNDLDVGSTAPALLPGTALAVQGGKAGKLDLLDLHRLDGTSGGAGPRTGGQLQTLRTPGSAGVFSAPLAFRRRGTTYVVVADGAATAGYALSHRRLHQVWEHHTAGTSPILAGGLLFVYDELAGRLRVMKPVSGRPLASFPAAPGHWSSPIVLGGRVILPVGGSPTDNALTGKVLIYHLPGR
ncbi:MAG: PQQ-binding-like beta-propeller repeat protein [Solirubrobacterales bacterium]|nr:PQQ-binding-like beta-propeller repeat protein [Solirubrobacterales bacterium]